MLYQVREGEAQNESRGCLTRFQQLGFLLRTKAGVIFVIFCKKKKESSKLYTVKLRVYVSRRCLYVCMCECVYVGKKRGKI